MTGRATGLTKAEFYPTTPANIQYTLEIIAPLKVWTEIKEALDKARYSQEKDVIIQTIQHMIRHAEKHHHGMAEKIG